MTIYGDPESPSCIEIGIRNDLLTSLQAKQTCVRYVQAVLTDPEDRSFLATLDLKQDLRKRNGLTFEITPETAEDAYGGWWVSVYDEQALDLARATPQELEIITQPKKSIVTQPSQEAGAPPSWNANDLKLARQVPDIPANTSGGSVYVRGYTRKDGTYVSPHTRSAPRR